MLPTSPPLHAPGHRRRLPIRLSACSLVLFAAGALALPSDYPTPYRDMTFSIDVQGPTIGQQDGFYGQPIFGTDILTPQPPGPSGPNPPSAGPLPTPGIFIANPPWDRTLPVPGMIVESPPGLNETNGWGELDAMSFGHDPLDPPFPTDLYYAFSVDEFAIGLPGTDVRIQGALGNQEAAADTFIVKKPSPLPAPPDPGTNYAFTDGDGVAPSGQPGVGLVEPNPPTVGSVPDPGDNLDALDFDTLPEDQDGPLYFSLDSAFADPLEILVGIAPPNYGTAAANGFVGGDVLVGNPDGTLGSLPTLYAAAGQLGLDQFGVDTDDLDALKLHENGIDGYQVSTTPFDWLTGATDMLLFSVRRGSAVIGELDSIFGIPIEEGDILTAPCTAGATLPDGTVCVGGYTPGIFTAAENLGLATVRSGTAASWGVINDAWGVDLWADDLDALDEVVIPAPGVLLLMSLGLGLLGVSSRRHRAA